MTGRAGGAGRLSRGGRDGSSVTRHAEDLASNIGEEAGWARGARGLPRLIRRGPGCAVQAGGLSEAGTELARRAVDAGGLTGRVLELAGRTRGTAALSRERPEGSEVAVEAGRLPGLVLERARRAIGAGILPARSVLPRRTRRCQRSGRPQPSSQEHPDGRCHRHPPRALHTNHESRNGNSVARFAEAGPGRRQPAIGRTPCPHRRASRNRTMSRARRAPVLTTRTELRPEVRAAVEMGTSLTRKPSRTALIGSSAS